MDIKKKIDQYLSEIDQYLSEAKEKNERWAFSKKELKNPKSLNSDDELIATVGDEGVIVYRNGEVSNRYEDGTAGVVSSVRKEAEAEETLWHPKSKEETYKWKNVIVDRRGKFVRFA